jgi:hypothetical protein
MKVGLRLAGLGAATLLAVVLVGALIPTVATAAEPGQLSWSYWGIADPNSGNGPVDTALSCPSAAQCTLLDSTGTEATFDPQSNSQAPTSADIGATASISCPATDLCVGTDGTGDVVTFNPSAAAATAHQVTMDANGNQLSISCPTTSLCAATEDQSAGDPGEITFNPASPPTDATPVSIDPGGQGLQVSCPAGLTNLCVAVDQEGKEVTFNPNAPSGAKAATIVAHNFAVGVSCPPDTTAQCTALDATGGFITFNPSNPGSPPTYGVAEDNYWGAVACSTPNVCTAADSFGRAGTFDPTITNSAANAVQPVSLYDGGSPAAISCPEDLSQPSQIECVDLSYAGAVSVGTGTIAPPKPSCTVTPRSSTVLLPPVDGQPAEGNEGQLIFNVLCRPTAALGIKLSLTGHLTQKSGQQTTTLTLPKITQTAAPGTSVALTVTVPSAAVTGLEHGATESVAMALTATDSGGSSTATSQISKLSGVPAAPQPTQLAWTAHRGVDPGGQTAALDCPSMTQCTLLDGLGNELTFNPLSPPAHPAPVPIGADWAISCPSTSRCAGTDGAGDEITFNPQAPPGTPTPVAMDMKDGTALNLSCPTMDECAAVETSNPNGAIGTGGEITFDPGSPPSDATPTTINPNDGPLSVACPIGVAALCVAVNGGQDEVTFDPNAMSGAKTATVAPLDDLFSVACPPGVNTQCTALGGGPAYTFNPNAPGNVAALTTFDTNGWDALACPTKALCTAVDALGHALTFDPTINPSPKFWGLDIDGQEPLLAISCPVNPSNPAQFECVALDDAGNVFVGVPVTPKPPKPSCTLGATTDKVGLPAKNSQSPSGTEGKLFFAAKCSPSASVGLTGRLTEVLTQNGRSRSTTYTLPKVTGSARAGSTLTLAVKLPAGAVTGLEHGAHEAASMTLTATDAGGSSTATAKITKLVGERR